MGNCKVFLYHFISAGEESKWRKVLLGPLYLLSLLYGWIVSLRVQFYSWSIFRIHSLPCKVVSVGNITLGGTGKTPFVCLLAGLLKSRGLRVAILSRGYSGDLQGDLGVVTNGQKILMSPQQAGDEPYLLAEKLQGVPIIVGRNRYRSGRFAVEHFQSEVLILDDGFQHIALRRDVNFLLLDASSPFGNGNLLPRGVLREPVSQLLRADAIILTKIGMSGNISDSKRISLKLVHPGPFFQMDYEPCAVRAYGQKEVLPLEHLKGKKVLAFSGVARPESFQHTLRQLDLHISAIEIFPDHHWYGPKDWERLLTRARGMGVDGFITTEKDLVRIKNLQPSPLPLWAVSIRHFFPGGDQSQFENFLFSRMGGSNE
ncbi:MAG: tetraacyldisaccharide 4'-kinase, partial [Deltaproteobacteria bacterium]|nr:tetraacyldisaccharide 4'-kinase [Deltaproteobacteria bacterium]